MLSTTDYRNLRDDDDDDDKHQHNHHPIRTVNQDPPPEQINMVDYSMLYFAFVSRVCVCAFHFVAEARCWLRAWAILAYLKMHRYGESRTAKAASGRFIGCTDPPTWHISYWDEQNASPYPTSVGGRRRAATRARVHIGVWTFAWLLIRLLLGSY